MDKEQIMQKLNILYCEKCGELLGDNILGIFSDTLDEQKHHLKTKIKEIEDTMWKSDMLATAKSGYKSALEDVLEILK